MALIITGIGEKGNLSGERIGFRATAQCDLKHFLIFHTNFTERGFYNRSKDSYWFAPTELKVGDRVVLYTKQDTDSFQDNDDGTKTYFYYWGLSNPIFTDANRGIVLAEIDNWSLSKKF